MLIEHPWLSLVPAALLFGLWASSHSRTSLIAAVLWVAYLGWEYAIKETSHPVLLVMTIAAVWFGFRRFTMNPLSHSPGRADQVSSRILLAISSACWAVSSPDSSSAGELIGADIPGAETTTPLRINANCWPTWAAVYLAKEADESVSISTRTT